MAFSRVTLRGLFDGGLFDLEKALFDFEKALFDFLKVKEPPRSLLLRVAFSRVTSRSRMGTLYV